MNIKLSAEEREEFLNKIGILLGEPELMEEYNLSFRDKEELKNILDNVRLGLRVITNNENVSSAVKEEMLDAAQILSDQLDEMCGGLRGEISKGKKAMMSRLISSIKKKFNLTTV